MRHTTDLSGRASARDPARVRRVPRLIRLITEIKTNPRQTPHQLHRTLGISRAQFFQDKQHIEAELGFRFRYSRPNRRYEILEDPYVPVLDLRLSEAFALILAVRQLSATGGCVLTYEAVEGIKKLVASAHPELRSFLQIVLDEMVLQAGFGCDAMLLENLRRACADHRHIIITYHHYDHDTIRQHALDPYQLFFMRRALYLDAYDKRAKALHVFRVNRIKTVKFLGATGAILDNYSFTSRFQDTFSAFVGEQATIVTVRFTKRIAPYVQESLWHCRSGLPRYQRAVSCTRCVSGTPKK
jgi:predicted DNA-binding transcriptional regulator YafY